PAPIALEALERVVREYCPPDMEIRIVKDDVIPRKKWEEALGDGDDRTPLAKEFLDNVPDIASGTEVVYVLFSPRDAPKGKNLSFAGLTEPLRFERDGGMVQVDTI